MSDTELTQEASRARAPSSRLVPVIIGSALFMQTLDSTIIANALPAMAQALHENPLHLNLALSAYFLSTGVFMPISAWLADRFGSRMVFMAAIALFAITSAICGLSENLLQLVLARAAQGMAGAMMIPVGRLVLLKTVPKSELVNALTILTVPALIGPIAGPLIGGSIVTFGSWRWIFFINIPIGLLGLVLVNAFVPNVREETSRDVDAVGFIIAGTGLAALVYGFDNLGRDMIPPSLVATLILGGVLLLWIYARHARRIAHPIMDLSLFDIQTFRVSVVGGLFSRFILGASPFLLAIMLQVTFGLSAFAAGLLTFASGAGALFMKGIAPPLLRRYGFRRILIVNTVVTALATASYALIKADTPHLLVLLVLFVGGLFRSLQFTALNAIAFADVSQGKMSNASSVSSVGQQLSQAVGVGLAAITLHITALTHPGTPISQISVAPAYIAIAFLSLCSLFYFFSLPHDVAQEMSGYKHESETE